LVKKCTTFEVGGVKQRPRKTSKEVLDKSVLDVELKPDDAMDHNRHMAQIKGC